MNVELELLCGRVVDAVLNGGCQGLLLTGLVLGALLCMRRSSAATRHNICLITLLLVALLPAAHLARSSSLAQKAFSSAALPGMENFLGKDQPEEPSQSYPPVPRIETAPVMEDFISAENSEPVSLGADAESMAGATITGPVTGPADPSRESELEPLHVGYYQETGASGNLAAPFRLSPGVCVAVVLGSAAIAAIRLMALGWQLATLARLKRTGVQPAAPVLDQFRRICAEMKLARRTELYISREGTGPCATGFWRPAVLAPPNVLRGGAEGADPILRHELAHIARGDDWASLFQQVISAVLFFHPAVWLLARRVNVEREIACDDQVLAASPNRRRYALLLTEFASQSTASRWSAAPAAWGSKSQLRRRIDMILNKHRNSSPRAAKGSVGIVSGAALLAAIAGLGFAPRVAFAEPYRAAGADTPAIEVSVGIDASEAPLAVPATPAAPVAPARLLAAPAAVAEAPLFATAPAAEPAPRPRPARKTRAVNATGADADSSVEERLARLERMVEQLLGERGPGKKTTPFRFSAPATGLPHLHDELQVENFEWNDKELARVHTEVERANKNVERVVKEIRTAQANQNKNATQPALITRGKDGRIQRQALEAQRKALERQLHAIEQRLDAMEEEEERLEERREREMEMKEKAKHKLKNKDGKSETLYESDDLSSVKDPAAN